jgi:hypothetical protein
MVLVPWDDISNPGVATGNPMLPLADAARQGMCQYRQNYPLAFQNPLTTLGITPRPIQRFNDDIWDRICPEPEYQIPQQSPPFFGGQCDAFYSIVGTVEVRNTSPARDLITNVRGPLADAGIRYIEYSPSLAGVEIYITDVNGNEQTDFVFTGNPAQILDYFFSVERVDGAPDNCGDRPIPPPVIVNPPPTIFPVNVNIGGQDTELNIIPTDLTINPDNSFEFSPVFEMGGFNFRPTIEGVEFDNNPQFAFAPDVDVNLSPSTAGGALGLAAEILPEALVLLGDIIDLINNGGGQGCDLTPLADYIQCLIEKPNASITPNTLTLGNEGGVFSISDGCIGVIVTRSSTLQPGTKIQSGSGTNPNVEYWGWSSFGFDGNFSSREPLHYENTVLTPPPNANQVLINPTFANKFNAVELVEVNDCTFTP